MEETNERLDMSQALLSDGEYDGVIEDVKHSKSSVTGDVVAGFGIRATEPRRRKVYWYITSHPNSLQHLTRLMDQFGILDDHYEDLIGKPVYFQVAVRDLRNGGYSVNVMKVWRR